MFIELTAEYTKVKNTLSQESFQEMYALPTGKIAEYTGSSLPFVVSQPAYSSSRNITPASENLKRAMFRSSSKAIAKALE